MAYSCDVMHQVVSYFPISMNPTWSTENGKEAWRSGYFSSLKHLLNIFHLQIITCSLLSEFRVYDTQLSSEIIHRSTYYECKLFKVSTSLHHHLSPLQYLDILKTLEITENHEKQFLFGTIRGVTLKIMHSKVCHSVLMSLESFLASFVECFPFQILASLLEVL